jgi:hypothetical protein
VGRLCGESPPAIKNFGGRRYDFKNIFEKMVKTWAIWSPNSENWS